MSFSPLCRDAICTARRRRDPRADGACPPGLVLPPRPAPPRTPVRKRTLRDIPVAPNVVGMDLDDDDDGLDNPFDWKDHIATSRSPADELVLFDEPEEDMMLCEPTSVSPPGFAPTTVELQIQLVPPSPSFDEKDLFSHRSASIPVVAVVPDDPPPPFDEPRGPVPRLPVPQPGDEHLIGQLDALALALSCASAFHKGVQLFTQCIHTGSLSPRCEARARYHRARCLIQVNEPEDIVSEELERSLLLDPQYYICARTLASLHRVRGRNFFADRVLGQTILFAQVDELLPAAQRARVLEELRADLV